MKKKFPNCSEVSIDEGNLFIQVLSKDDNITAKQIQSFINGIDDCLKIQKMESIFNRFKGKRNKNKQSAKDIIFERMQLINI